MKVMLAIAFLLSLMKTIHTCGTSTHISIAHEAATFYQGPLDAKVDYASLIQKHQDAFVAGNPYPDAMYPSVCFGGKYHEVAEDTHWAPFLNATVNYIRRKYPQPWDEATEKLVAFTFGYISHQVADISWHSLAGFKQGFIQAMANVNFHGVFDKAHTDADVGGDMLTQFDNSDDPIGSNTWYVPVDDLYEIYKEFYGGNQTIPKTVIELCSELLYIEYIAEKFAGAKIFKPFVKKSPFLLNQLDNYFLGGIHDMAAWTSKIWNETVFMLEHGTSACNMERSTMHVNCTGYLPAHNGQSVMARKNPGRGYPHKNGGWSYNDVHKTKSLRGVYFTPGEKMTEYITGAMEKRKKVLGQTETSEHSYSQIGKSMEEIKTPDDTYYLVISAPTYSDLGRPSIGKVWFIPTSKFDSDKEEEEYPNLDAMATRIMKGTKEMGRFGWSIKHSVFRKDPTNLYFDLMISAPTAGGDSLTYKGEVNVYYGTKEGLSLTPDKTLTIDPPPKQPLKHAHTNYGYSLAGDRYITINSPFFSNQSGIAVDPLTFQTVGQSNQDYSWYGYSRSVQFVNVPQTYLSWYVESVGAPNYRICKYKNCTYDEGDLQAGGQLSVFQDGKLIQQWTGASHFEELGYSSSVGYHGRFIAVSSPGADVKSTEAGIPVTLTQAGLVSVYYFPDKYMSKKPVLVFRMLGDRAYGRFGEIVRLQDVTGDFGDELIVSAPRRTTDVTEELNGGEEGAVFIYKLPEVGDQPITFTTDQAFKSFIGTEHNARLGSSIHVMRGNKSIRLLTGATTSSKYGFKSGLLHSFLLHKYQ